MSTTASESNPTIRSLGVSVFLPSFMLGVGQGAVIPIVALAAIDLGASLPMVGLIVALRGIGTMLFDIPSGMLVSWIGERRAMVYSTAVLIISLVGCAQSRSPIAFAGFTFLMGCTWSVWLLARQVYVTEVMPIRLRGRALSTVGGMNRIGLFIGPFLAAISIQAFGLEGAFYLHVVTGVIGCAALVLAPDAHEVPSSEGFVSLRIVTVVRDHKSTFLRVGFVTATINLVRASRQVALPLWADHVGLSATAIVIIFGFSSAIDMLLFYPAGFASDRWGRRSVAVPCVALLALGHLGLPFTGSYATVCLAGLVMGLGNGLGSGIVMTLGADFSPQIGRANFLGVFRLIGDGGTAMGPVVLSMATAVTGLGLAVATVGVLGLVSTAVVAMVLPPGADSGTMAYRKFRPTT